ncbi:MAG: Hpt domain-containing protein [Flavobacteriales bacterium]|nr:Hpt domain-containing protein [Flavobacteriales bacterium]
MNIDLKYLKEVGNGDMAFVQDIIETFVKVTPDHVDTLITGYEKKDWLEVKRIAHTMKPNVEFMGILSLKSVFVEIDRLQPAELEIYLIKDIMVNLEEVLKQSLVELELELKDL